MFFSFPAAPSPSPSTEAHSRLLQVRPAYSKPIPVLHQIDPMRTEGGFVRGPNVIPGCAKPPESPIAGLSAPPPPPPSDQWHGSKRTHEATWMATSSVPVRQAYASQRPSTAKPSLRFLHKAAGLPGGLSLAAA